MSAPWTCASCCGCGAGASPEKLDALGYEPPTDPDARCSACGARLSAPVRTALLLERIAAALAAPQPAPDSSRYMTSHEAAGFYRFPSVKALWMATQRHASKYPHERKGRRILYVRPAPKG